MMSIPTSVARVTVSKIPTKLSVRFSVAPGLVSNAGELPSALATLLLLLLAAVVVVVVLLLLVLVLVVWIPMVALHS